jgi:hypothetical protein
MMFCTGFTWLRIGTNGGFLWTKYLNEFEFHKRREISWLPEWVLAFQQGLFHRVNYNSTANRPPTRSAKHAVVAYEKYQYCLIGWGRFRLASCRVILNGFSKKGKQRKITYFLKPKSPIPARVDLETSISASDMMESDAWLCADILI